MSERRNLLYIFTIAALLILGMMSVALPVLSNTIEQERRVGPTPNVGSTVSAELTRIAWEAAQQLTATQIIRAAVGQAITATADTQATSVQLLHLIQTSTASAELTRTAGFDQAQMATRQAQVATQHAQIATDRAHTATLAATITALAGAGIAHTATTEAQATLTAWRGAAIRGAAPLTADNAAWLEQLAAMRYDGPVEHVAFSPDGNRLAAAYDSRVLIWTVNHWAPLGSLQHSAPVTGLVFSPTGDLLAAATDDGAVWLWDASTGLNRAVLKGHADTIFTIVFSPDGTLLASAGTDKTILWEAATGRQLMSLNSGWVWNVVFSPDGRFVVTSGGDGNVRLWGIPGR